MIEYLTTNSSIQNAGQRIGQLIKSREEWFYSRQGLLVSSPVRSFEISLSVSDRSLMMSCVTDEGLTLWRIWGWEWSGEKLLMEVSGKKKTVRTMIELIPRASARAIAELVSDSRRTRCYTLAQMACAVNPGARILKMGLSPGTGHGQPGRDARIFLEQRNERIAVSGTVAEDMAGGADSFLSSALIWFLRTREQSTSPRVRRLLLATSREKTVAVSQRLALLSSELKRVISQFEINQEWTSLNVVGQVDKEDLLNNRPRRLRPVGSIELTATASQVISIAPQAIDVVRARGGETLRFHGLAFARVRRLVNREHVWFGTDISNRQLLDARNYSDWDKLLSDLLMHRRAAAGDRRHAFYRAAPEAWLESILRRDISRLDPGLRIAPIHAQFRTSPAAAGASRPVDLLALRHDGRLAVIELKVSEDRNHVLQGVDYWRHVEAHRRCGNIQRARLFEDAKIADVPPLVYLAAPMLSFHRAFQKLALAMDPDIKIYRFDLNEDWRGGVRVMRVSQIAR